MNTLIYSFLIFFFSLPALSRPYYRFWRGYIANSMKPSDFIIGLNQIFIPETIDQGVGKGLIGYLPVMPFESLAAKGLPDELALVVYESKQKYDSIRSMPKGSNYQKMHWDFFDKERSGSLVPVLFNEKVEAEKSFDLLGSDNSWQTGQVRFVIRTFANGFSENVQRQLKSYFQNAKKLSATQGIVSHIVLVGQNSLYEYILFDSKSSDTIKQISAIEGTHIVMNKFLSPSSDSIDRGKGLNKVVRKPKILN